MCTLSHTLLHTTSSISCVQTSIVFVVFGFLQSNLDGNYFETQVHHLHPPAAAARHISLKKKTCSTYFLFSGGDTNITLRLVSFARQTKLFYDHQLNFKRQILAINLDYFLTQLVLEICFAYKFTLTFHSKRYIPAVDSLRMNKTILMQKSTKLLND